MRTEDFTDFRELMQGVHDFYGRDLTEFAMNVWWEAMRPFDLAAVRDALNRHVINPDTGQFMPKPADAMRMLGGRTIDAAQRAWAKVDRAVRTVGTWASVVFDDPRIHRVIEDMGGWILLGGKLEADWPFVAREFEGRYRAYLPQREVPEHLASLAGLAERENVSNGRPAEDPVLIGDEAFARRVLESGGQASALNVVRISAAIKRIAR